MVILLYSILVLNSFTQHHLGCIQNKRGCFYFTSGDFSKVSISFSREITYIIINNIISARQITAGYTLDAFKFKDITPL